MSASARGDGTRALPCALALLLTELGCSSATHYPTSTRPPDEPRRPPGISLNPTFAAPSASDAGPGFRVAVLPVDSERAKRTVEAFFDAVVSEDGATLLRFFAPGAQQQLGPNGEVRGAADYWQRRLARLDYGPLREKALFRPSDMRLLRPEQAARLPVPLRLEPRQVAVIVPLLTTHVGSARVFGSELTFVLQENGEALTLARIIEDFQFL